MDFEGHLFISTAIFEASNTDLEHELLHWAVEMMALPDDENERLAMAYEAHVRSAARP